jgi:acyl dehydratase
MDDTFRHVRTCDRLRPVYYAAASGDFNPVHLDGEAARRAGLPSVILHGMCTYAWLAEACSTLLGERGRIRRMAARFSHPVLPGDAITFQGRCATRTDEAAGLQVTARNQRGEDVLEGARVDLAFTAWKPSRVDPIAGDRRYGPYRYEVGAEKIREFALAVGGGSPARSFGAAKSPVFDASVAPPTFAAAIALQPCADALSDPATGVDVLRVLHGEEEIVIHGKVLAGDVLETAGQIVRVEKKRNFDVLTMSTVTANQRGELVLEATSAWIAR